VLQGDMERSAVLAMENRRENHKQESSRIVDRENTRWIRGKYGEDYRVGRSIVD
jgi:hypothetical protein